MKTDALNDDLFWLAMRYVQNELSDAERIEFETCLEEDVAACEAVAEAMRLTAGLQLAVVAAPLSLPSVSRPPARRAWPVAVCAALVLAIGVVFASWPALGPTETDLASLELVNHWRLDSPFAATELNDLDDLHDEEAEVLDESLSAPGWMMSAVRLSEERGARPRAQ